MRLVRFDNWQTGVVVDRKGKPEILDIEASLAELRSSRPRVAALLRPFFETPASADWAPLITAWREIRPLLEELKGQAEAGPDSGLVVRPFGSVRLRPPISGRRSRAYACGGNFAAHMKATAAMRGKEVSEQYFFDEKKRGLGPQGFFVLSETIVASGDPITPPVGTAKLDHEAEVAVLISSAGRNLRSDEIEIWGVAPWHDVSIRDPHLNVGLAGKIDRGSVPWGLQKNWYSGNVCGPWIAVDEVKDYSALKVMCRVNGELRQSGCTADMIWRFEEVAAFISEFIPLEPGDLFTSGSPAGTALESGIDGPFLKNGDIVEVEIEGVGTLQNRVVM